jgi:hypothetical protein
MVEDIEDRARSALNPSITTRIDRAGDIQAALAQPDQQVGDR